MICSEGHGLDAEQATVREADLSLFGSAKGHELDEQGQNDTGPRHGHRHKENALYHNCSEPRFKSFDRGSAAA